MKISDWRRLVVYAFDRQLHWQRIADAADSLELTDGATDAPTASMSSGTWSFGDSFDQINPNASWLDDPEWLGIGYEDDPEKKDWSDETPTIKVFAVPVQRHGRMHQPLWRQRPAERGVYSWVDGSRQGALSSVEFPPEPDD